MVLFLIAVLILLGMSFLVMAQTENTIAQTERLSAQALYAAESGTRAVKRWFDRPRSPANLVNPAVAVVDRSLRLIDADGDPGTPPVAADGSAGSPYYKQGVDLNGDGQDDLFDKPYRGSLADTLLGSEAGPDMRIDENASVGARTLLRDLSEDLFDDYPSRGLRARITRIDIYAPPYVDSGGTFVRFGLATVKVIASVYQLLPDGTEEQLAERMVRIVLNEIPYTPGAALGPLHSCDELYWNGEFTVHWGVATAVNAADLHNNHEKQAASLPRVPVAGVQSDVLWGYNDDTAFGSYKTAIEGIRVEDPWFRVRFGGALADAPSGAEQPWPFTWIPGTALDDGDVPYHPGAPGPSPFPPSWDGTHSNILQNTTVGCPELAYELWKSIATSGGNDVHYYTWDSGTSFREDGTGPARTFRDITDQQTGFFFFDTQDAVAPYDSDGDGVYDNLTPGIAIAGGRWGVRGLVYLNAAVFQSRGVRGRPATFQAPGEPYQDKNLNNEFDNGEDWVNLDYPTTLAGNFIADSTNALQDDGTTGGVAVRNTRGPAITDDALVWGILYTNGYYDATGNGIYYGTVISKQGIGFFSPSAGTPDHYWDESLNDSWPPDGWGLPRVAITRWETDM